MESAHSNGLHHANASSSTIALRHLLGVLTADGGRYGEMERQQLLSDLRSIPQQDSSSDDLEALAAGLAECARAAVEACHAGLHRCQRLTSGLELGPFAATADDCLTQHITLLQVSSVQVLYCLA